MTRRFHVQSTISHMIELVRDQERRGLPQNYLERDGEVLSNSEAIEDLLAMRYDGRKFVPCCDNCNAEGRCQGVPVLERRT